MPRTTAAANAAPMPQVEMPDVTMIYALDALSTVIDLHEALYMAAGDIDSREQQAAMQALCEVLRQKLGELGIILERLNDRDTEARQ